MLGAVQASLLGVLRSSITYILHWAGAGASDQSFANTNVIDTAAEGIVGGAGSLTVSLSFGTVDITSSNLVLTHDASDGSYEAGVQYSLGSKTAGKGIFYGVCSNDGSGYGFRHGNTNNLNTAAQCYIVGMISGGSLAAMNSGCSYSDEINSYDGTSYNDFAVILGGFSSAGVWNGTGTYGAIGFAKKRSSTTWKLVFPYVLNTNATIYGAISGYSANKFIKLDYVKLIDGGFLTNCAPTYTGTPDSSSHDTGNSDFIHQFHITTPASLPATNPTYFDFNIQDSNNFWRWKIIPKTSGTTITLHKVVSGVEGSALKTLAQAFAANTKYQFSFIKRGSNWRQLFSTYSLSTYYTTDSEFATSTTFQWTPGDCTINDQAQFKTEGYTFSI